MITEKGMEPNQSKLQWLNGSTSVCSLIFNETRTVTKFNEGYCDFK